ncbi:proline dehydrogenase family protein [Thalassospira lucentensis]|uniref:proline dehydrogenase family protein n=1 Tax=Thalassospira lucentensis TaxID=168935 RepID=UPI0003B5D2E1|nr:proline dehydrogenase family protein [Thalassospira lucentensis]RCK29451.1 proline dehydrogenase [Thalassospira lucentensis MCCC 1A00383 = DSM 14000]
MGMWQKSMIAVACSKPLRAIGEAIGHKTGLADQFVSARDVAGHVARAEALAKDGIRISSFYLGEYVTDLSQVRETAGQLEALMPALDHAGLDVHISIDPSQLGYMQDQAILDRNVDHLAAKLSEIGGEKGHRTLRLMIDMEDIDMVDDTLRLHHRLADGGYQVAQTLQARLHRTKADLRDMIKRGAMVRLVKGAMASPDDVAFTKRQDIDENYLRLSAMMLSAEAMQNGFFPVFGTHDRKLAWAIIQNAKEQGWSPGQFEFEMLYGVNQPLQRELVAEGYRLRLYAPFGKDWWAYAWRRVGENPRNIRLLLRSGLNR